MWNGWPLWRHPAETVPFDTELSLIQHRNLMGPATLAHWHPMGMWVQVLAALLLHWGKWENRLSLGFEPLLPAWDVQVQFQASGFGLAQSQLLRPVWGVHRRAGALSPAVSASPCHSAFQINKPFL